jgi:hypothetical protein
MNKRLRGHLWRIVHPVVAIRASRSPAATARHAAAARAAVP